MPQFTNVEDKIIGPFTLKQFIYLAGAAGACVVVWTFLPTFIAIPLMIPIGGLGAALAFFKVNNRPFIRVMESYIHYLFTSKLYIWRQDIKSPKAEQKAFNPSEVPKLSESKLRDLMWSLDVKQSSTPVTGKDVTDSNV